MKGVSNIVLERSKKDQEETGGKRWKETMLRLEKTNVKTE